VTIADRDWSGCSIRPCVDSDVERVAHLAGQLGYRSTPEEVGQRVREMQRGRDQAVFVAETADGQVAGWIGTHIFRSVELDAFAEISGLVVDETHRSRGVGARLVGAAEQWARSVGARALCVRCNIVRERAHRFYVANGYEQIKIQKIFRKPLRPTAPL
jgi:GNAT superfamily N-acetyltransferase